jgi:hypothetical protein
MRQVAAVLRASRFVVAFASLVAAWPSADARAAAPKP